MPIVDLSIFKNISLKVELREGFIYNGNFSMENKNYKELCWENR